MGGAVAVMGERRKGEERRVWQEEMQSESDGKRSGQEAEVWRAMQTDALQGGRWDLWCKEMLMICILMLWQLPFHKPAP